MNGRIRWVETATCPGLGARFGQSRFPGAKLSGEPFDFAVNNEGEVSACSVSMQAIRLEKNSI